MRKLDFFFDIKKFNCSLAMAIDEIIYKRLLNNQSYLAIRCYKLKNKSVTIGKFQKNNTINIDYCNKNNIEISRRITGGRGVFHNDDIIISAIFNQKQFGFTTKKEIFDFLPSIIRKVLTKIGISFNLENKKDNYSKKINLISDCFMLPVMSEISINNNKFLGVASYVKDGNVLQQSSLQFNKNSESEKIFYSKQKTYFNNIINENIFLENFKSVLNKMFTVNEIILTQNEIIEAKKKEEKYKVLL
jgi:lipoyl(octanoyl) transferase